MAYESVLRPGILTGRNFVVTGATLLIKGGAANGLSPMFVSLPDLSPASSPVYNGFHRSNDPRS